MKIIVVGSGIIGALTAFRMAQAGVEVTLVEAGLPSGAASGASFGWINASFYLDEDHFRFRQAGIEAHRRLAADLGSEATRWSGCLCWEQEGAEFDAHFQSLAAMGYDVQEVGADAFSDMEPAIAAPERALYFPGEGSVDLSRLTGDALRAASALGTRWITGVRVSGLVVKSGGICGVTTEIGDILADRVVVAAGVGTEALLGTVDVPLPMLHRPAVILRSEPVAPLLRHILVSPGQELRQTRAGSLLAPTAASHQGDDSDRIDEAPDALADAAMARVSALIGRQVRWEQATLAARPMPQDGLPVIGACGPAGLYAATLHSGATLAPLVAELVAAEVLETGLSNAQSALLAPYRPERFRA